MMTDDFRTRVWELRNVVPELPFVPDDKWAEWLGDIANAGYEHAFVLWSEEEDGKRVAVAIAKRCPLTMREAGDAMAEVLDGHAAGAEVARLHAEKLSHAWREAVESRE